RGYILIYLWEFDLKD
ncbi:unnamed protein product, partial [Allacma fusca]